MVRQRQIDPSLFGPMCCAAYGLWSAIQSKISNINELATEASKLVFVECFRDPDISCREKFCDSNALFLFEIGSVWTKLCLTEIPAVVD